MIDLCVSRESNVFFENFKKIFELYQKCGFKPKKRKVPFSDPILDLQKALSALLRCDHLAIYEISDYSSEIAPVGHVPAQAPQLIQASASITY